MSYAIEFEKRAGYLYAQVTGTNSAAAVAGYLRDVLDECKGRDCYRVLIDERLTGPRLNVEDVFSIASDGAVNAMSVFHAVAYVDEEMGETSDFAETVAINRGMPVKTFPSVELAEAWLLAQVEEPDEKKIFRGDES